MLLPILLIIGGAALATMGVLRITRTALPSMPPTVAAAITLAGVGVLAFGAYLPRSTPTAPVPHAELVPEPTGVASERVPTTDIQGEVTAAGDPVADAKVKLTPPEQGDDIEERITDADGVFAFEQEPIGGPYAVTVRYDGADFTSPPVFVPSKPIEMKVAPITNDASDVRIRAESLALVGDEQGITAIHVLTVVNDGREAFAGELRLALLPGATSLAPSSGLVRSRLEVKDGQLISDLPILPGKTQITFTYVAPTSPKGVDLAHSPSVATERFELLTTGDLFVRSSTATRSGDVTLGGRSYRRSVWSEVEVGAEVRATVASKARTPVLPIALSVAGVALAIALVVMPLLRRRRSKA